MPSSRTKAISPTQREALAKLALSDLIRLPGGYWTSEAAASNLSPSGAPEWWFGTRTITALHFRGMVVSGRDRATLTDTGRKEASDAP